MPLNLGGKEVIFRSGKKSLSLKCAQCVLLVHAAMCRHIRKLMPLWVFIVHVNQRWVNKTNWLVSNKTGQTVAENWPLVSKYCRSMQLESCWLKNRCGFLCEVATESRKVLSQPVAVSAASCDIKLFFVLLLQVCDYEFFLGFFGWLRSSSYFAVCLFLTYSLDVSTPVFSFGIE